MTVDENEPTYVILRRAKVPEDRRPRKILPGDYFAVIVNSKANKGSVPTITSYFDHSMAPTFGEVPLSYYYKSVKVGLNECPTELIDSLSRVEPVGRVVYRKKLSRKNLEDMWRW